MNVYFHYNVYFQKASYPTQAPGFKAIIGTIPDYQPDLKFIYCLTISIID
jgi:hypothetical protein